MIYNRLTTREATRLGNPPLSCVESGGDDILGKRAGKNK